MKTNWAEPVKSDIRIGSLGFYVEDQGRQSCVF